MDAFSAHPVSSLRAGPFPSSNPRDPHLLKTLSNYPNLPTHPRPRPRPSSSLSQPSAVLTPKLLSLRALSPSRSNPPPPLLLKPPSSRAHRKASTGYAAALLDVARCDGAIDAVERDVRRFARAVRAVLADPSVEEGRKGEVVRAVAENGGFYEKLVALVKMLVGKRKVGMVGEVMVEFRRIWEELSVTHRVVAVPSSESRTEEGEKRASGPIQGKKIRHFVWESSARFAM